MRKTDTLALPRPSLPSDADLVRDYAYHLYEQSGRVPGRDLENWLEAEACLAANLPADVSHHRLPGYLGGLGPVQQEELCEFPGESRNLAR